MPSGRLIKIENNAKSAAFPDGFVFTAIQELKAKLYKVTSGNRRQLKAAFESVFKFPKNSNTERYMNKLIDMQFESRTKYTCAKTDEDIIDQILKILGRDNSYAYILKRFSRNKRNIQR